MKRNREINVFSLSFLDLISGALGAVIILFVAVPKAKVVQDQKEKVAQVKNSTVEEKTREVSSMTVQNLEEELKQKDQSIAELKALSDQLKSELEAKSKTQESINQELLALKMSNTKESTAGDQTSNQPVDVGFNFKGKRILFLIDISGSMLQEDRIGQVKAGLKMLITSMSNEFKIDVVSFPSPRGEKTYAELWGTLRDTNDDNKVEIYKFLNSLRPNGPTPTRDVLRFAFNNYYGLTDIVLLTDGSPTKGLTREVDDIYSILYEVGGANKTKVQVNAVGVGSDFLADKSNIRYIFLEKLSREHKGFFVGF
jgi:Mg-chelatase subunit ChlD